MIDKNKLKEYIKIYLKENNTNCSIIDNSIKDLILLIESMDNWDFEEYDTEIIVNVKNHPFKRFKLPLFNYVIWLNKNN